MYDPIAVPLAVTLPEAAVAEADPEAATPVVDSPRDALGTGFKLTLEVALTGTVVGLVAAATLLETEVALETALELDDEPAEQLRL